MAKALRGEYDATLGGEKFVLRLAIGNLEELEAAAGCGILELANRFTGRMTARLSDARLVIREGLRGGGHQIGEQQLTAMIEDTGMDVFPIASGLLLSCFVEPKKTGNAVAAKKAGASA